MLRRAPAIVIAVGCLAAAIGLQIARDRRFPRTPADTAALLYVRSGEAMRRIVLSFDSLAADVYWIRAVQHYGGDRLDRSKERKYELLYPLLDITTSLDPYFTIAYRFGSIFLSEPYPGGAGRPDLGIELLQKGIRATPEKWQYYHDIAFVYYWQQHDTQRAVEWFRKAAAQPGAPNWLEPIAANLLIQSGDRQSARFLLEQLRQSDQPWLQRMAERGLLQVQALEWIDVLRGIVARNPPPEGQSYSWAWLVRRGVLRDVPTDPTGTPFAIDADTGAVTVSSNSSLYPMPNLRAPQP